LAVPPELDLPVVEATPPYNEQIAQLAKQLGNRLPAANDEGRLRGFANGPETSPSWIRRTPEMSASSVDLPAPSGPINPTMQ
jgi:hypothetical protein